MGNKDEKQRKPKKRMHADHNKTCGDKLTWPTGFLSATELTRGCGKKQDSAISQPTITYVSILTTLISLS